MHLFFLLLSLEQVLQIFAIGKYLVFLAKFKAMASISIVSLYFVLVLKASVFSFLITTFLLICFSLKCLFKFTTLSYYCFILLGGYSVSINFFLITLLILLLNYSTNSLLLFLLSLTTLLNSYTNFSIVLLSYSIFF